MEAIDHSSPDERGKQRVDTQRLVAERERLELRARLLLAEHRHVVESIRDMQRQIDAAGGASPR